MKNSKVSFIHCILRAVEKLNILDTDFELKDFVSTFFKIKDNYNDSSADYSEKDIIVRGMSEVILLIIQAKKKTQHTL